ncbi:transporter [Dyella jiangningensis]|nr:transporter [Dyella jiangningensis]AHX13427.1 transporter [Dyella jiangningensis]
MSLHLFARSRVALGLAAVLWSLVAVGAEAVPSPLSLEAAVRQGLTHAPLLESRQLTLDAMREEAVRAGRLPDPTLTTGLANFPVTSPGAFSLTSDSMTMRTLGVTQALPSRAARQAERRLADAQIDAAEADHVATVQTVQERIADAWIEVWAAEQARMQLDALREESALATRLTEARLRGGTGNAADPLAARSEAAALANRVTAIEADLAAARASLARWLPDAPSTLADAPDFGQLPVPTEQLQRRIDQQASMQTWQAREKVAEAVLEQARASKHPDWSIGLTYGQRARGLSDMVMVEVGVSLPLFTRNRQDRSISAKQSQWDAVQADHEDARRAQQEAISRALAVWQGWGTQIQQYRDHLLPLARDRAATALAGYRGGGELDPWLQARRDEIELRLAYVNALASRARLWAAMAYLLPSETTP